MTSNDFYKTVSLLEDFYGKKLNQTQARIWSEKLKNYSAERFEKTIEKLFETSQYMPTLSQVLTIIPTIKLDKKTNVTEKCKACRGTGYVMYKQIIQNFPYEFVALCNCQNSIGKEYDGRKTEGRSDFYISKAEDIFLKG